MAHLPPQQTIGLQNDKVSYRSYRAAARAIFTLVRAFCPPEGDQLLLVLAQRRACVNSDTLVHTLLSQRSVLCFWWGWHFSRGTVGLVSTNAVVGHHIPMDCGLRPKNCESFNVSFGTWLNIYYPFN